jgi:hypothetical protein
VEHVAADDEVVRPFDSRFSHVAEGRQAEVPAPPIPVDGVLARIEPGIAAAGTQPLEHRLPAPFAGTHVENRAQGAAENLLGGGHGERRLAGDLGGTLHPAGRVPVPAIEVAAVVALGSHAGIGRGRGDGARQRV